LGLTLLERLGALRSELARLLPEIGEAAAGGTTEVAPVFESVTHLIGDLARTRPMLLVLEDLHWADEMSARLFAFVGRRLAGWPVLLVATARDDELADALALRRALDDLARDEGLTTLILRPLSRPDTLTLVSELAQNADKSWLERVGEHAWLASEGNPFVVVETVRAHTQGVTFHQERGLGLPERVQDVVSRRLDRFSKGAQTVTAVASVIGREFEFCLLQQATSLGEEATAAALEELVRGRVLHGLGERFDFTHDRIREVAYRRILMPRRKLIHRRVAETIEATYGGQLTRHALALGLHYRAAEVWDRAAQYLGRAGEAARERAASSEAVACFDTVLACLTHLPESRKRSERIIDTILSQDGAFVLRGEFQRSLAGLRRAEALASSLGDGRRLAQCLTRTAYHLGSIDLAEATKKAEQACVITREVGDAAEQMWSNAALAWVHYARGDYRGAIGAVRENDALASGAPQIGADRVCYSWFYGILALTELGEFAEALVRGEQMLGVSAAESGRRAQVWAHLGVGRLCLVKGELPRAIEVLEWCLPLCEVGGDLAVYFYRAASSLGSAYALSGRIQEAIPLLERADSHADAYGHAVILTALAEARLLAGDIQQAGRDIARARALAHQHGQRGREAWALRLSGEIAARSDPREVESAEACFSGAIALARKRSMRPLVAHCHLGLGGLYRRIGDGAKAEEHLAAAAAMYRDMSMGFWLSQAEAGGAGGN
jgi:tetratricopeptide (TPR) repeat protein